MLKNVGFLVYIRMMFFYLQSPADLCGKIEKDDEVIQVNYQTVVSMGLKRDGLFQVIQV